MTGNAATTGEVTCAETRRVTAVTDSGSELQVLMEDPAATYHSNMAAYTGAIKHTAVLMSTRAYNALQPLVRCRASFTGAGRGTAVCLIVSACVAMLLVKQAMTGSIVCCSSTKCPRGLLKCTPQTG